MLLLYLHGAGTKHTKQLKIQIPTTNSRLCPGYQWEKEMRLTHKRKQRLLFNLVLNLKWRAEKLTPAQSCQNTANILEYFVPKHGGMSSFRLNNGFRLLENENGCQSLEISSQNAISSSHVKAEKTLGTKVTVCSDVQVTMFPRYTYGNIEKQKNILLIGWPNALNSVNKVEYVGKNLPRFQTVVTVLFMEHITKSNRWNG